jgi:hypothetical protein
VYFLTIYIVVAVSLFCNLAQNNNREIAEYFGVLAKLINKKSAIYFFGMKTVSLERRMEYLGKPLIMK